MKNTTNTKAHLRIHPAVGIGRVGNSDEFYLGPETMAAEPQAGQDLRGGLPIKPGTESTPITSDDLRDANGKLKKQAARFKIYQYNQEDDTYSYPSTQSEEVVIGSMVDGKKVADILWTVHLANKKANCWMIDEDANEGIKLYEKGQTPPIRNPNFLATTDPSDKNRLKQLIIDAGPRVASKLNNTAGKAVKFDKNTPATYATPRGAQSLPGYPVSFPMSDGAPSDYNASSVPIDYLGEIQTDDKGRLIVAGGNGKACGFNTDGNPDPNAELNLDVDNNNWLDDTADGPVTAILLFDDGSHQTLKGSAWVVITDPAYAPQTLNVVSLWENVYTNWLENFGLNPSLYTEGAYNPNYKPTFSNDVYRVFNAAHMQMWNTNLNKTAINGHRRMADLTEDPAELGPTVMSYIRKPNDPDGQKNGSTQMPLSLGDSATSFLTVTTTQYFLLEQWSKRQCVGAPLRTLTAGEQLDKTILVNSLGGRFSPGIEMTFIVTDPDLYNKNWKNPAIGPFRINAKALDYTQITPGVPFLGVGYTPLRTIPVEPGDVSKFMAVPWHTDYNSCATHTPAPNPGGDILNNNLFSGVNTTLFWSWPAQRPVAVYTFEDLMKNNGVLPQQRFSLRGEGTEVKNSEFPATNPTDAYKGAAMQVGRYSDRKNFLLNWYRVGTIIQGPAIDGYDPSYDKNYYLEVASQFTKDDSNLVVPWRNKVNDKVYPAKN